MDESQVTFMVFSILRPQCLLALLQSLRLYYPRAPVVIATDNLPYYPDEIVNFPAIRFITFPDDTGSGACYNHMIDKEMKTPWVVLLDDDYVFTERTRIERLLEIAELGFADFVGGAVRVKINDSLTNYVGTLRIEDRSKGRVLIMNRLTNEAPTPCEIMPNFWLTSANILRDVRWDPALKLCRHQDFFLRAIGHSPDGSYTPRYTCFYSPSTVVDHDSGPLSPEYRARQQVRFPLFKPIFLKKWNFVATERCQI